MGFNSNYFVNTNNIFNLKLKPNQFTILSYLIRMANNTGSCYPSMNNIAEMCCVSKSTVSKTIDELVSAGFIRVDSRRKNNEYSINYEVVNNTNNREKKKTIKTVNEPENVGMKSEEEMVKAVIECSTEEAVQALMTAENYHASNRVKYAIGVIKNKRNDRWLNYNKANSFHNYSQRNYTKEEFRNMERLLLTR